MSLMATPGNTVSAYQVLVCTLRHTVISNQCTCIIITQHNIYKATEFTVLTVSLTFVLRPAPVVSPQVSFSDIYSLVSIYIEVSKQDD